MAKAIKKKGTKKRASTYEPKLKFEGTFEDMIAISTTGAGVKKKRRQEKGLMQTIYIFRCNKIGSRYGFTFDKSGGMLPVLDCEGWTYFDEVKLTSNTSHIMDVPIKDVLYTISLVKYHINETDLSIYDDF